MNNLNKTLEILNQTHREYQTSKCMLFFLSILYGTISLVSVIGNSMIILVVYRNKKMRSVTNYFISNLALADLVIGLFATPFQFQAAYLQRWIFPDIMCKIAPFASTISANVNITTLVAISLDRYHVILHPLDQKLSKKQCICIIIIIWVVSVSMSIGKLVNYSVFYFLDQKQCGPQNDLLFKYEIIILAILQYIVPFCLISLTYFKIGYHIYFGYRPTSANDIQSKTKRKAVKMVFIVVLLFIICWMPIQVFNVLNVLFPDFVGSLKNVHIIWFFSNSFAASNSCYNVFIYGICSNYLKWSRNLNLSDKLTKMNF
ncbi:substance-P receptor [Brachionus plicatilis]|uniref:Substance-P receptor n=1 Tax=Brachionus plicatilis TaxID=10195 RepID=A0A3M7T3T1_BRAPC|nr:substance-P receptor [Brachionus plicatilis]